MLLRKLGFASTALALISAGCTVLLALYSYKTGCTADLKTGSLGNPQRALHFSGIALAWFVASVLSGTLAIGLLRGVDSAIRMGLATAFFFFGGFAFWLLGGYFETVGLQSCFAP